MEQVSILNTCPYSCMDIPAKQKIDIDEYISLYKSLFCANTVTDEKIQLLYASLILLGYFDRTLFHIVWLLRL